MTKELAKRIMDKVYETRDVDELRQLCQMACESATSLDTIITDQIEFQRKHDVRAVELIEGLGKCLK